MKKSVHFLLSALFLLGFSFGFYTLKNSIYRSSQGKNEFASQSEALPYHEQKLLNYRNHHRITSRAVFNSLCDVTLQPDGAIVRRAQEITSLIKARLSKIPDPKEAQSSKIPYREQALTRIAEDLIQEFASKAKLKLSAKLPDAARSMEQAVIAFNSQTPLNAVDQFYIQINFSELNFQILDYNQEEICDEKGFPAYEIDLATNPEMKSGISLAACEGLRTFQKTLAIYEQSKPSYLPAKDADNPNQYPYDLKFLAFEKSYTAQLSNEIETLQKLLSEKDFKNLITRMVYIDQSGSVTKAKYYVQIPEYKKYSEIYKECTGLDLRGIFTKGNAALNLKRFIPEKVITALIEKKVFDPALIMIARPGYFQELILDVYEKKGSTVKPSEQSEDLDEQVSEEDKKSEKELELGKQKRVEELRVELEEFMKAICVPKNKSVFDPLLDFASDNLDAVLYHMPELRIKCFEGMGLPTDELKRSSSSQ